MDEAGAGALERLRCRVPDLPVLGVSALDDDSLDALKEAAWALTGLIRVYLRHDGDVDDEPLAIEAGATVLDVAAAIHKDVAAACRGARVWGASARFPGQRVGREHRVADGDVVEVLR
jgi:uncharacterized protein